jgi:hypothetical protein
VYLIEVQGEIVPVVAVFFAVAKEAENASELVRCIRDVLFFDQHHQFIFNIQQQLAAVYHLHGEGGQLFVFIAQVGFQFIVLQGDDLFLITVKLQAVQVTQPPSVLPGVFVVAGPISFAETLHRDVYQVNRNKLHKSGTPKWFDTRQVQP